MLDHLLNAIAGFSLAWISLKLERLNCEKSRNQRLREAVEKAHLVSEREGQSPTDLKKMKEKGESKVGIVLGSGTRR